MLIDTQMPEWEQRMTRAAPVDADVRRTYQAIREVDLFRSPLLSDPGPQGALPGALLRWADGSPRGARRASTGFDQLLTRGFQVVADDGATELVLGFIGRWWRDDYGQARWSPGELPTFDLPGYGVGVWSLTVLGYGEQTSVLVAEVRLRCTDAAARDALGAYFALTSPLITAMGQPMLRLIRRAAERGVTPVAFDGDGSSSRWRQVR
ncbi:hypothetical protein [Kribbella sp. NPDC004875]|uniref:hypothetical protein n=1 Tax=Kribbella sp. NPDC004875 TaxID=3364107 RepID=UPI0036B9C1D4